MHILIPSLVLSTWREVLYEEVKVGDPGSPVVILILGSSAICCVGILTGGTWTVICT